MRFGINRIYLLALLVATFSLSSCAQNDTGTVHKALIGHWDRGTEQHYFSENEHIVVSENGTRIDSKYTILTSNEDENWIKIRITTNTGLGHDKLLQFSRDRRSITQSMSVPELRLGEVKMPGKWIYVDSRNAP